jgi:hypothetical protein
MDHMCFKYKLAICPCEKKNIKTFMQNDDVNRTYLFIFHSFIIYFMMTVISIYKLMLTINNNVLLNLYQIEIHLVIFFLLLQST